jgi:hypothetical protein
MQKREMSCIYIREHCIYDEFWAFKAAGNMVGFFVLLLKRIKG